MSAFVERPVEMSKTEWLESLQRLQVSRTDMNRLVMNYLVTGKDFFSMSFFYQNMLSGAETQFVSYPLHYSLGQGKSVGYCCMFLLIVNYCQDFDYAVCLWQYRI